MVRVALVGLGKIGLLFDTDPASPQARSHAKAIALQPRLELRYGVDPVPENQAALRRLAPQASVLDHWDQLASRDDFDLLVICVPTSLHFPCLQRFFARPHLKAIILEKPAFSAKEDYAAVPEETRRKLIVNYTRRFSREFGKLREEISSGLYGEPVSIHGLYSKGLRNNGSHLIDLVNFLFDSPEVLQAEGKSRTEDYFPEDPSLSGFVRLRARSGTEFDFSIVTGDERKFSVFELDLLFSKARIRLPDFARRLEIFSVRKDPLSPGYLSLDGKATSTDTNLPMALSGLYSHVLDLMAGKTRNISDFNSECWNNALVENLLRPR